MWVSKNMLFFQQVVVTFTVTPFPLLLLSHVIFDTFFTNWPCTEKVTSTRANLHLVLLIFTKKCSDYHSNTRGPWVTSLTWATVLHETLFVMICCLLSNCSKSSTTRLRSLYIYTCITFYLRCKYASFLCTRTPRNAMRHSIEIGLYSGRENIYE